MARVCIERFYKEPRHLNHIFVILFGVLIFRAQADDTNFPISDS
jgi:hypothetical protein